MVTAHADVADHQLMVARRERAGAGGRGMPKPTVTENPFTLLEKFPPG